MTSDLPSTDVIHNRSRKTSNNIIEMRSSEGIESQETKSNASCKSNLSETSQLKVLAGISTAVFTFAPENYQVSKWEVIALGIATVIDGQYSAWNAGLSTGFGSYFISVTLMATAYICLVFCISEIASAIPFSGGAFGMARVCLGYYLGFIIGVIEFFEYIIYASTNVYSLGKALVPYIDKHASSYVGDDDYYSYSTDYTQWLIWFLIFFLQFLFIAKGGRIFWNFITLLAVISLGFILIYFFGCLHYVYFNKYAPYIPFDDYYNATTSETTLILHFDQVNIQSTTSWFRGGMFDYMKFIPLATYPYGGIEALALNAGNMKNPKTDLPFAMIGAIFILVSSSLLLLFTFASMPPGGTSIMGITSGPLNYGFNKIFHIDDSISSQFELTARFALSFGFLIPSARLVHSLGQSKLLPSFLGLKKGHGHIRYAAFYSICIGYLLCILQFYFPKDIVLSLLNCAVLCGFLTYIAQLVAFIMLRGKYSNIERSFKNPLGIPSAIFACLVFSLGIIAVIFFQDSYLGFYAIIFFTGLATLYYFFPNYGPAKTQILSEEEQKTLFRMNIINVNLRRIKKSKRSRKTRSSILARSIMIISSVGGHHAKITPLSPIITPTTETTLSNKNGNASLKSLQSSTLLVTPVKLPMNSSMSYSDSAAAVAEVNMDNDDDDDDDNIV